MSAGAGLGAGEKCWEFVYTTLTSSDRPSPIVMYVGITRVVYDRVRKRKDYFEFPAFFQIERGKSRVGNSKSNENKNVFVYVFI